MPASDWETIMFNFYEIAIIEPTFRENIRLDKRFIDEKIGVWRMLQPNDFNNFQTTINKMCKLEWITSPLNDSIVDLDLEIWIDRPNNSIKHKSHVK